MFKIFLIVAIVGTLTLLPYFYDNTDYEPWSENDTFIVTSDRQIKTLKRGSPDWKAQSEFDDYHKKLYKQQEKERLEGLSDILKSTANVCTNGIAQKNLSLSQYINEFIKGPCAPVLTVPGIIGTALQVKIDCEILQAEAPEVFSNCGWNTCDSSLFKSKPSKEYKLWIAGSTAHFTILQTKKNKCFGDFIRLEYDSTQSKPSLRYRSAPGITVTWEGNTDETNKDSECGTSAIENLTTDLVIKSALCDVKGYKSIHDTLKNMGYIPGLTMQAIPYDFRLSIPASESKTYMKNALNNFHSITGKKSYIVSHSLGSLHAINLMYEMSQTEKNKLVAGVLAMGGPQIGAPKTFKPQFGGDDTYLMNFLLLERGLNFHSQTQMAWTASSLVDLYPKDTFIRFRNQPWMVELLKRMNADAEFLNSGFFPTTNIPLSWFPSPTSQCGASFSDRPDNCLLMMSDLSEPFLKVGDKEYLPSEEQLKQAILDNIAEPDATRLIQFMTETRRVKAINLDHPGVPMIILYGAHSTVPYQFSYNKVPKDVISQTEDLYLPEHISYKVGDSTVTASSAMTVGIKWIYEHQKGQTTFPTKLVEYCSEYNGDKSSIYDQTDYTSPRSFTQSGYLGLQCQCRKGKSKMDNCSHACMISDPKIVEFIADMILNGEPSTISTTPYTDEELKNMKDTCINLKL